MLCYVDETMDKKNIILSTKCTAMVVNLRSHIYDYCVFELIFIVTSYIFYPKQLFQNVVE